MNDDEDYDFNNLDESERWPKIGEIVHFYTFTGSKESWCTYGLIYASPAIVLSSSRVSQTGKKSWREADLFLIHRNGSSSPGHHGGSTEFVYSVKQDRYIDGCWDFIREG